AKRTVIWISRWVVLAAGGRLIRGLNRLDEGNRNTVEVLLDPLGLAVEMMDLRLLAGDEPAPVEPLQQLIGCLGLDQADRRLDRRRGLKGGVRDRDELAEALAFGEIDRSRLDQLPVQSEGVVEPPGLDHAFERDAVGLPAVAGPL